MPSIGEQLRDARERKGTSLAEVAQATRIKVQQLEDLENDDYSRIAAPAYAKGFLKMYAKYLDLPTEPLLEQYTLGWSKASSDNVLEPPGSINRPAKSGGWFRRGSRGRKEEESAETEEGAPVKPTGPKVRPRTRPTLGTTAQPPVEPPPPAAVSGSSSAASHADRADPYTDQYEERDLDFDSPAANPAANPSDNRTDTPVVETPQVQAPADPPPARAGSVGGQSVIGGFFGSIRDWFADSRQHGIQPIRIPGTEIELAGPLVKKLLIGLALFLLALLLIRGLSGGDSSDPSTPVDGSQTEKIRDHRVSPIMRDPVEPYLPVER